MSSKKRGGLSNPKLRDKQNDVTSASIAIQTYVQIILQQPDLNLDALPALPKHQQTARNHAENWNEKILPLMAKTDADIIDYANQFDAFYNDLVKCAKDVKNQDSKKKLVDGLKHLQSTIQKKLDNVNTVVQKLTTLNINLNTDYRNFEHDVNTASVKIEGNDGELKSLSTELDAIHKAMNYDIVEMAVGAAAMVGSVIAIVVGMIATTLSGGATLALIGGGVLVFSGGVVAETLAGVDYNKKIDEQRKVQEKLKDINQELIGLKTAKAQVEGFLKCLDEAITAVNALCGGWEALDADLQELITAIQDVDPNTDPEWLLDELKRAKSDWEVALEQAKKLQPDGKLPTKRYKNLQDAFKEMQKLRSA